MASSLKKKLTHAEFLPTWVGTLLAGSLGTVFLLSGIGKLVDLDGFINVIPAYINLASPLVEITATLVTVLELLLGAALILGILRSYASLLSFFFLLCFTVALAIVIHRGLDIDCGCFPGLGKVRVGYGSIIRNVLLMTCSLLVYYGTKHRMVGTKGQLDLRA